MKAKLLRLFLVSLLVAFIGASVDYFFELESNFGLKWLFKIRGTRPTSEQILILAIDEKSEQELDVDNDLKNWRRFHSVVVDQLDKANAGLIVFDLQFIQAQPEYDQDFARSIRSAGNVMIVDCIQKLRRGAEDFFGREQCSKNYLEPSVTRSGSTREALSEQIVAMRKIMATPNIASAALDHAPFYLIKDVPNSPVRESWLFYDNLAGMPSLPVLIWAHFLDLAEKNRGYPFELNFSEQLSRQRQSCLGNPRITDKSKSEFSELPNNAKALICGSDTVILNYYGPPRQFKMESYTDAFHGRLGSLNGKIVLIGKTNTKFTNSDVDAFYSPYSTDHLGKMSGVEIMATQLNNLLDNSFVTTPIPSIIAYLLFTLIVLLLLDRIGNINGLLLSGIWTVTYIAFALFMFSAHAVWFPIAIPLIVILPLTWMLALAQYRHAILIDNQHLKRFDQLTNLPNRSTFNEVLQHEVKTGESDNCFSCLLLINLDNFKFLNETLGHHNGDLLIKLAAQRLKELANSKMHLARISGGEFVLLLTALPPEFELAREQAETMANNIWHLFQNPFNLNDKHLHFTASIGVVLFKNSECHVHDLIKRADIAANYAKNLGRNTWQFFIPEMEVVLQRKNLLRSCLRNALSENQLILYFQAQLFEDNMEGAEVLLRWDHPDIGFISPVEFIPVAEESGIIVEIGYWVLETACRHLTEWEGDPDLKNLVLAVNVSAHQFSEENFVACVADICHKTKVNPHKIKLELTESAIVGDIFELVSKIKDLKAIGIKISLDDFGTGYSSLAYLSRLPLDQLKIDQSFVRNITEDSTDAAIAKNIIDLANTLNLNVIAEGVETQAQMNYLNTLGCRCFQGYLVSKPLPVEQFVNLVLSHATLKLAE